MHQRQPLLRVDRPRLERLLGGADNARLRRRLRERLLAGGTGPITLTRASEAERAAVERLLGRPPRQGQSLRVDPAAITATLQHAGIATDLHQALEALDGPLHDPAAERATAQARWAAVVDAARPRAESLNYQDWLEDLARRGLLKRLAGRDPDAGRALLDGALTVLAALPGQGINRSTLAARCLGDAHALDRGQPVAALVRHALRHRHGADPPDERSLWAEAGVLIGGDINSTVLTYQLPAAAGASAPAIRAMNAAAEPIYLTLRQLLRQPTEWAVSGQPLFVCENPTIVAEAAERLGTACAPLIATVGQPGAAVFTLLDQLGAAGAVFHVRADLDGAGIHIANGLFSRYHAIPWRMDTATLHDHAERSGRSLDSAIAEACWDPALATALRARGEALEEEQILDHLLNDLSTASRPRAGG